MDRVGFDEKDMQGVASVRAVCGHHAAIAPRPRAVANSGECGDGGGKTPTEF
jgi:hypothetical protein